MPHELPHNVLLAVEGRDVQGGHADLGARLPQAHAGAGEHIEDVGVAALGGQVDRGEADLLKNI